MPDSAGATIIEGPVAGKGPKEVRFQRYVQDPDGNLLEFMIYSEARQTCSAPAPAAYHPLLGGQACVPPKLFFESWE